MSVTLVAVTALIVLYLMYRKYMRYVTVEAERTAIMADKYAWLLHGIDKDWVRSYCATHDSYLTSEEEALYEEYDDPCINIFRLMGDSR